MQTQTIPLYYRYWGKAKPKEGEGEDYHLLPYHCLDVVAVADIWLQKSAVLLNQISQQIELNKDKSKSIVLFFIALHDLGKFEVVFKNLCHFMKMTQIFEHYHSAR